MDYQENNYFPNKNSRPEHSWLPEANDRPVPKQESWGDDSHSTGIITTDLPCPVFGQMC